MALIQPFRSLAPAGAGSAAGFTFKVRDPMEYAERNGYSPTFLGVEVPPPTLKAGNDDLVEVTCPKRPGETVHDLLYTHFSTWHSKGRLMPYFSCVNLNGKAERKIERRNIDWRCDPRIPLQYQLITHGIYGKASDGLFSRGHMTRREDPNWGSKEMALLADEDTFHVTNACPQVQSFNAPIWLALEDYVKDNSWDDDMRVSVMTGPVFADDDPQYRCKEIDENGGVVGDLLLRVPVEFWKVVIFQHDDSGEVVATAYKASQAAKLPRKNRVKPQFVFGAFEEYQMRIADLEEEAGLDFGDLRDRDVLRSVGEGFTIQHASLSDVILAP